MPSAMIHLKTALEYEKNASPLFLIGTLAPDCLDIREIKDKTHFRISSDRTGDLRRLRDATDKSNPFDFGVLLHLFLDYKWDNVTENEFGNVFFPSGAFEFRYYREQITHATSYIYNHTEYSKQLWETLCSVSECEYDAHPDFRAKDIKQFLLYTAKWNEENSLSPSEVFVPEYVNGFILRSAAEFSDFLQKDIL